MPKKILLADDSITIQKVVELTFSDGDYEVTAVNNGAKAVARLGEMRPDIILSDIIMPEKNGYEVCEYVKSHPEYRNIPVVLLTGTFEPFDPDRAEKAGCDAVVTKPFESQSLIHKVEELISQSRASAAPAAASAAPAEPEPASPWADDSATSTPSEPSSPFGSGGEPAPAPEPFTHGGDIFGTPPAGGPAAAPFDAPPPAEYAGETRALPKLSFDDLQSQTPAPEPAAPWDEPAAFGSAPSDNSTASFGAFQAPEPASEIPAAEPESPFGSSAGDETADAPAYAGETRAFPKMSFEDMQRMAGETAAPPAAPEAAPWDDAPAAPAAQTPEPAPWDEQPAFGGGETRAFPKMSFEDFQQMAPPAAPSEPEPAAAPAAEASPWDEPAAPAFEGETRAFQKLSFDDLQAQSEAPASSTPEAAAPAETEAAPWEEPAPPAWSPTAETNALETPSTSGFAGDTSPFASSLEPPMGATMPQEAEPAGAGEPERPAAPSWTPAAAEPTIPIAARGGDLSDEQVDRIARRVVELMSDSVVRNIAWEVIPDLAEMVVKERIRQLESEA